MKTKTLHQQFYLAAIAVMLSCAFNNASAQGAYVTAGLGYGLPSPTTVIGTTTSTTSAENILGSYGKGINFGVGVGYMFTENIGAEIGFSYLSGAEYEYTILDSAFLQTGHTSGKIMRLMPALKVTAGKDNFLYAKFGLVLGFGGEIKSDLAGSFGGFTISQNATSEGGSSMGWVAALGADFPINDMISIYAELNSISQTWAPDKSTNIVTLGSLTTTVNTTYDDQVSATSTNASLKEYLPFSSFGINAGVKIAFGGQ
ncbi:MAG TPA: outer membrane beta-barrel protein [Bacteroidia bacterium]|nr:outer membrane beta-barrel protein [Bacteroidia bacterium]